jgi:hypothetical protein
MGAESRQLFRHIDLGREKRQLLLQPLSFGVEPGLTQARAELFGKSCLQRRNPGRNAHDLALDAIATFEQHGREFRAFALARGGELGDCLAQESMGVESELLRRNGRFGQDPGQRRISPTDMGLAPGAALVTWDAALASSATRADPRRDPRYRPPHARARSGIRPCRASIPRRIRSRNVRFEPAQFVRQANLEVEEAVVDGTQFDGQGHRAAPRQLPRSPSC